MAPSSLSLENSGDWRSPPTTPASESDATSGQPKDLVNSKRDLDSNFVPKNLQKTNSWVIRSKLLSSEFNNVKDEAELGKLMGDDGEKLLALVDDIRKIDSLRDEKLNIPQVFDASIILHIAANQISRL